MRHPGTVFRQVGDSCQVSFPFLPRSTKSMFDSRLSMISGRTRERVLADLHRAIQASGCVDGVGGVPSWSNVAEGLVDYVCYADIPGHSRSDRSVGDDPHKCNPDNYFWYAFLMKRATTDMERKELGLLEQLYRLACKLMTTVRKMEFVHEQHVKIHRALLVEQLPNDGYATDDEEEYENRQVCLFLHVDQMLCALRRDNALAYILCSDIGCVTHEVQMKHREYGMYAMADQLIDVDTLAERFQEAQPRLTRHLQAALRREVRPMTTFLLGCLRKMHSAKMDMMSNDQLTVLRADPASSCQQREAAFQVQDARKARERQLQRIDPGRMWDDNASLHHLGIMLEHHPRNTMRAVLESMDGDNDGIWDPTRPLKRHRVRGPCESCNLAQCV